MKAWRKTRVVVAAIVLLSAGNACAVVGASGTIVAQERDVAGFTSVAVSDGLTLELRVDDDSDYSVRVRYDDNLIDRVITRVDPAGLLIIEFDGNVNFSDDADHAVEVVMPRLEFLRANGGSAVQARGKADAYSIRASGGAAIDAAKLRAETVDVEASGGSAVVLRASIEVTGDASGGAAVSVKGNPPAVGIDTSGGATVDA